MVYHMYGLWVYNYHFYFNKHAVFPSGLRLSPFIFSSAFRAIPSHK